MKKRDELDYLKHIKKEDYLIMNKGEEVVYKGFRNNDLKLREDLYGDSKEFHEKEKCDLLKAEPFEHECEELTLEEFSEMLQDMMIESIGKSVEEIQEHNFKELSKYVSRFFNKAFEEEVERMNEKFEKEIIDMLEFIDRPSIEHIEFAVKEIFEDYYEYCRFVSVKEEAHLNNDKTYQYIITAFSEDDLKFFEISFMEIK